MKKVCFAASSGGHIEEILNLIKMKEKYRTVILTEHTSVPVKVWMDQVYFVPQVNRSEWTCMFNLAVNAVVSLWVLIKEKPDLVISIGALATIPICLWARLMGKKVIYIESFARRNSPSATGKLLYRVADTTIVQWEEMLQFYPKAIYGGAIY